MSHAGKQRIAILKRASIGIVVAIFGIFPALVSYAVSPPNIVTYQGRLLDSNNVPVTSTSVSMIFELYTDPTAGTCVWSNSSATCATATARTVTLTDGLFSEDLGDTSAITAYAAIGDAIFADNAALYLRVTVAGEPLSPRKRLTAAPYALNAETLDGVDSASFLLGSGGIATGSYDFTGAVFAGTNALVFEGSSADDFETIFAITNPTVSDRTITFQNASGTVAFTSDIPAGASLWEVGTNGTYEDDAAVIVGTDVAFTYVATAGVSDLRVGDDFEAVDDGFFGGYLVVGATTSSTETLANADFTPENDDLFVAGTLGVEGNLYTDGSMIFGSGLTISDGSIDTAAGGSLSLNTTNNQNIATGTGGFDVGGHAAIGGTASVGTLDTLTLTESLACTSDCSSVQSSLTNTTATFMTEVVGGDFTSASAVASGATGRLIGLSGTASTTGAVVHAGSISGVRGRVAATAASTWADVDGLFGEVTLNGVANVDRAAAVNGSLLYTASPGTLQGSLNLFYGSFSPSVAATIETFKGIELGLDGTLGTINNAEGISVSMNSSLGLTLNSANRHSGIGVTMNTAQTGNDPTIYGVNVSATTGADGTTAAYGVRSTASGGDTNFAGYFYGSLVQIDGDENPDNNMQLISAIDGPGDLYVARNFEADGDGRFDGGDLTLASTGNASFSETTTSATGFAGIGLTTGDGGGVGGDWEMYTLGASTTVVGNGAANDLRWSIDAIINNSGDVMRLERDGTLFLDDAVGVGAADLAEVYVVADASLGFGDVVALTSVGDLVKASDVSGEQLFGVVSTNPGLMLGNGEDDVMDASERFIALSGRVPIKVNLEGGAIAPGDPITSSSTPGEAKKAQGPGMILGFALESYTGSEGPIEMFMSLQWNSVGKIAMDGSAVGVNADLVVNALSNASASDTAVDSSSLVLRGSAFDLAASDRDFSIRTSVTNATDYRLSIKNAVDAEVAYIDQDGGFSVAGDVIVGDHLYPSDRGVPQTNRYIFYDGSSGPGGDFMRTNASGWATGSYDFAEMFPSSQTLEPGDVVVFASQKESVERGDSASRERIAGVVSTRPGFLAGENTPGSYPIALAGRVPTRASNEGGEIKVGDALTVSSTSGVAKKAQEPGMILGYALENFTGADGKIVVFINATYWNGLPISAKNSASGLGGASLSSLDLSGNLYIGANDILNVGSISGMGRLWEISSDGNLRTRGTLATTIEAYNGDLVDTFATTSPDVHVTLSGTAELESGQATVNLVKEHPQFLSVVSNMTPLRILASPNAAIAVYVTNRKDGKFDILQVGGASSGVLVDWYVIGVRKDFEREEDLVIEIPDGDEPEVEESNLIPETPETEPETPEVPKPEEASVEPPEVEPAVEIAEPEVEPVVEITEPIVEPEPVPIISSPSTSLPSTSLGTGGTGGTGSAGESLSDEESVESEETDVPPDAVAEPASGGEPPEPEQIPSGSSHDDAGVASEGSEE